MNRSSFVEEEYCREEVFRSFFPGAGDRGTV